MGNSPSVRADQIAQCLRFKAVSLSSAFYMHSLLVYVHDLLWVYASSFVTPFIHLYL